MTDTQMIQISQMFGEMNKNFATLSGQVAALTEQMTETRQEVSELKVEMTETRREVSELKVEMTETRREVSELKVQMTETRQEVSELKVQMTETRREVSSLSERVTHLGVLVEASQHETRVVAEGHEFLSNKIDGYYSESNANYKLLSSLIESSRIGLEAKIEDVRHDLKGDIQTLGIKFDDHELRIRRLERKRA